MLNLAKLREAAPMLFSSMPGDECQLAIRDQGEALSEARRIELLQAVRAGEHVELELTIMPFRQDRGVINRNAVRFKEGALSGLGKSGSKTPFLRDHQQRDVMARGGTVTASKMLKDEAQDGAYLLQQTVRLTKPWAVEGVLDGTIDRFSIGWNPTGPVLCSACETPVWQSCYHYPGDVISVGETKFTVEWVFTKAELVETSAVSVPAVVGTEIEEIRAALSVAAQQLGARPPRTRMEKLLKELGLQPTATEQDGVAAVKALKSREVDLLKELAAAQVELAQHTAKLDVQLEEALIQEGIRAGKIPPGGQLEKSVRRMFSLDRKEAAEMVAAMAVIVPLGSKRQSDAPEPTAATGTVAAHQVIVDHGGSVEGVERVLAKLGVKAPKEAMAKHLGGAA